MATFDVNANSRKVQSTANGSTDEFSFSFQVNQTSDIKVFVDGTQKTESTHYNIKNSSNAAGLNTDGTGKVVFTTGNTPANESLVSIKSDVPKSRTSVYTSGGNIVATALESDFDTITMQLGDNAETINRSLKAPVEDPDNVDMDIPKKADRLDKVLAFNSSTGNPEVRDYLTLNASAAITGVTAGTVSASKFVQVDANKDVTGFRNVTITGELDAATLDVSGDVDIDGTLEADAITVNGTTLAETISDTVGAMVTSNTETGLSVTYDDSDNTLDFVIGSQSITNSMLADDAVGADELASSAVVTASIVDDAVTQAKIADDAVGADQLASSAVVTASIVDSSVTTAKIADDAVTLDKMAGLARGKIIVGDASGNPVALALGTSGQVLKSDGTDLVFGTATTGATALDDLTAGDAATTLRTTVGNLTLKTEANDTDIILEVDDNGSQVVALTIDGSDEGNAIFVNDIQLKSDAALLEFGADLDTTLTHVADTGLLLNSSRQLQFGDSGTHISQSADGVLDLVADSEIEINATTIDCNGNLDLSNNLTIDGDNSQTAQIFLRTTSQFNSSFAMQVFANRFFVCRKTSSATAVFTSFHNSTGTQIGTITASESATAYNISSDYRLKENIVDINDGITRLKQLQPRRFNFKIDPSTTVDGFVAHEVTVVPEAITGEKDGMVDIGTLKDKEGNIIGTEQEKPDDLHITGYTFEKTGQTEEYQAIDQSKLVPLLTAALQEAVAKIEALETRVAALEG